MSDETENGSGNRATVAVAVEKIDGLREFTRAEFGEVKERIGKLEGLPERVTRLEVTQGLFTRDHDALGGLERVVADHEHRLVTGERERADTKASRAIHWPTVIGVVFSILVAIAGVVFH